MDSLRKRYLALGFKDDPKQENQVYRMVASFLANNDAFTSSQESEEYPREDVVICFLEAAGQMLWPYNEGERQHLAKQKIHGVAAEDRSPVFIIDTKPKARVLEKYKTENGGMEPSEDWRVLQSPLYNRVREYFRAVKASCREESALDREHSAGMPTVDTDILHYVANITGDRNGSISKSSEDGDVDDGDVQRYEDDEDLRGRGPEKGIEEEIGE